MAIYMLKIRRPLGRLIFNMGIAIPGKTVFLIETAPWYRPSNATAWAVMTCICVDKTAIWRIDSENLSKFNLDLNTEIDMP